MKTKLIVLVILINSLSYSQNVKIVKNEIQQSINKQKTNLIKTSDAIWEFAETSLVSLNHQRS